jgi:uncharacterized protein (DUF58 family)
MAGKGAASAHWLGRLLALNPLARGLHVSPEEVVFPPGFLASLERLRLVALRAIGGGLREGHRLGAYKGGQLEFHGHRNYVAGDELRHVDWNSYARLGRPYIKEFAREEAGVLHLLLDATPSMGLGAPSKWTFARRLAALFSHVALASKDVVRLYVFDGQRAVERFPRPGSRGGIQEFIGFLQQSSLGNARDASGAPVLPEGVLQGAVAQFARGNPPRGRVILISDFWYGEQEIVAAISRLSAAGFDVSGMHVLAGEEISPAVQGDMLARSLEEDAEIELTGSGDLADRYARELEAHRRAIEEILRKRGGNYLFERSDTSIERALLDTLRQRRWII